jgi:hypothetical protein
MQWTWLIVIGISIRVGVDIARYAALRAKRRSERDCASKLGEESADSLRGGSTARLSPVGDSRAAPLVCHWTLNEGRAADGQLEKSAHGIARGHMICRWTFNENGTRIPAETTMAAKRGRALRPQPRAVSTHYRELVN